MALSEEQIKKLIEWFITSSEVRKEWSKDRKEAHEENSKWIQPNVIQKMSDNALRKKFEEYYENTSFLMGKLFKKHLYRIIRDIKRFRKTILYLLDEQIDIKKRVDDILTGKYHIEGFGRAILTSFLMDFNIEKYCLWNTKTEMGFSVIGWKLYESSDSWGTAYTKVLNNLKKLRDMVPEFKLTYDDVDLFLHTISAEDEGEKAVEAITEGIEITGPEATEEVPLMQFALEKDLQEFIATNFERIFGDKGLELYQDKKSDGKEYQTTIGKIDLLAVDHQNKEFVIIELKKEKDSEKIMGQILRYMGWVKEHLASPKGYGVRAIIIMREKDEKLEYALKSTPNVNLFLYDVSFTLREINR